MRKAGDLARTWRIAARGLDGAPILLAALAVTLGAACSSHRDLALGGLSVGARSVESATPPRSEDAGAPTDPDHVALGAPDRNELDFEVLPVPGERSALLVAQSAGDSIAAVRRIDGKTGAVGPLLLLRGESVYGALDGDDDRFTLVTSASGQVCLSTYKSSAASPDARGCAVATPVTVALVGDRVALIEARQEVPPEDPAAAKRRAAPPKHVAPKPHHAHHRDKDKNKNKSAKHDAKPKKHTSGPPPSPGPKPKVDVLLRWATREGSFDADATPIGLRFERPYEGMNVVAAAAGRGGIDLLWYEFAGRKRKGATPAGDARLMLGTIGANGALDPASRKIVAEGPLEIGSIAGHRKPRLLATDAGSLVVDLDDEKQCTAHKITSALTSALTPSAAVCVIDPARLLGPDAPTSAETSSYERILDDGARRVSGQPRHDPGLVAWAGDRAYYVREAATHAFRSAARVDDAPRDEPAPFVASRSRIAWGALEPDGEGVAFAAGKLCVVNAVGVVTHVDQPEDGGALVMASDDPHADRRHVARIGGSWWIARGDVQRILPKPLAPASLAGHAHPDASALVGGRERGLFLDLEGPRLLATPIAEGGPVAGEDASMIASPVRVGFDAASRAAGGAIVAGVASAPSAPGAATSPVVAFRMDAAGHAGPIHATSLSLRAGALAVRVVALPEGGAILSDRERTHVVWLDDEGHEMGAAAWPEEESDAACLDGAPARSMMPAPEPGRFIRVADFAAPGTCVVGDPVWSRDGSLRYFGSRVRGLDSIAELGTARAAFARIAAASSPTLPAMTTPPEDPAPQALAVPTPSCPAEMVSIAQQFCVDRFEAELVDDATGERLSPDFTASPGLLEIALGEWVTGRELVGDLHARAAPLPSIAPWQRGQKLVVRAVSRLGVRPSGYVSGLVAADACRAAGKRLCSHTEFVTACRGEADQDFPYGDDFEPNSCNVFRDDHPAALLHGNASLGHLDPRLNRVIAKDGPMLRETGGSLGCRSRWGSDAVYDMVGNIDEWVDDPSGFAGGFYSRSTRSGCDAMVTTHPPQYLDYSLGVRCCKDASPAKP